VRRARCHAGTGPPHDTPNLPPNPLEISYRAVVPFGMVILSCILMVVNRRLLPLGVECPRCHTVYFVGHPANQERMYHSSARVPQVKVGNSQIPNIPIRDVSDLVGREGAKGAAFWISLTKKPNKWTLLCICSEQISFLKPELKWYTAPRAALERGYAIEGEWKERDQPLGWPVEVL